jgi:AAT family amino acid transporter
VKQEEINNLSRALKPRHIQLIALGGIIGSGYFLGTGYVVSTTGPGAFLSYLLGGLIVVSVMCCLGELAVAMPVAGSFVAYAREFISPAWACGMGWSYWLTWVTYVPSEMIAGGLIMNNYFPEVSAMWWAILFGLIITIINLSHVQSFGEIEFWLALIKISALLMFVALALLIFFGIIGDQGFIGSRILLSGGSLTPNGAMSVLLTMVIVLVNFQGSEIIGLAAGESKDPAQSIPKAIKNVSVRIISLYLVPILLLVSIEPWEKAGLSESVFAAALNNYGLNWAGGLFSFVVLTAAISCSNSGLYGCIRALYALSKEDMAPSWLGELNNKGVPKNAALFSIVGCWITIIAYSLDESKSIYTYMLALSGFSGAIAWISICWCQLNFRRRLKENGETTEKLQYKTPWFPYLTHFGIWAQVGCLIVTVCNDDLRNSLYVGIPLLILPIVWYKLREYSRARRVCGETLD